MYETVVIPIVQFRECTRVPFQMRSDQRVITQVRYGLYRSRQGYSFSARERRERPAQPVLRPSS
jgi:hypothetical protein